MEQWQLEWLERERAEVRERVGHELVGKTVSHAALTFEDYYSGGSDPMKWTVMRVLTLTFTDGTQLVIGSGDVGGSLHFTSKPADVVALEGVRE